MLWSPQIRVLVVTKLVTRNCSGKAKLTIEDSKVEKCSTSKNTKTEIINAFPKWFEGGLLTPGKSSMCATLARRTVTPTANLRERGEGGAVHCGALCSVYCFANSTVVISTEYFLTTFNVQYTIWNLCSAIYNMCTVQVHFVIASLCSRNNQRRLNFSPHRPAAPKLKSDDNEWCWWWRLQESHKEAQMAKQLRRFSSDLIPGHSKRLQRLENFFSKLSFFSQAFGTFQITMGSRYLRETLSDKIR